MSVKISQKLIGVKSDGIPGKNSVSAAVPYLKKAGVNYSLWPNDRIVKAAGQVVLNDAGYGAGLIDGIWGRNTLSAYNEYSDKNIVVTKNTGLRRIVMHWTAGAYTANSTDKRAYHRLVELNKVVAGKFKPEANIAPKKGHYSAHTRNLNSGSIGISICSMAAAVERDPAGGKYPIQDSQVKLLVREIAKLCVQYDIPVTRSTVLSHAEVQPTLGVKQKNKWDYNWFPGVKSRDVHVVGDYIRDLVKKEIKKIRG